MKRTILFFSACLLSALSFAQENKQNVNLSHEVRAFNHHRLAPLGEKYKKGLVPKSNHQPNVAGKMTSTPTGRWLNYGAYLDTALVLGGSSADLVPLIIWNDTFGVVNYIPGPEYNKMVSFGAVLHPQAYSFNDTNFYRGELEISTSDAYTVDSINLVGLYHYNLAKATVVDTLTISFVYGDPHMPGTDVGMKTYSDTERLSNHNLLPGDTLRCGILSYDSVNNTLSGASLYTMKYYLTSANWGDTLPNGIWSKAIRVGGPLGSGFNVPAGNMLGYTLTFKSGDPTFVPGSVIDSNLGPATTFIYNLFQPITVCNSMSPSVPIFSLYDSMDFNAGQFKYLPNFSSGLENLYAPMYEFDARLFPVDYQNSYNDIHITCPTCAVLGARYGAANVASVNPFNYLTSYPNPASENVSIKFGTNKPMDVSISIVNLFGQVVAIKDLKNTQGETVSFSTEKLPSGMYYYVVTTNGASQTGRIDIMH